MTARKQMALEGTEIGERIRELRQALGLTQEQLAARLGVSFPTVNRWENKHAKPSPLAMEKIEALAKRLHKAEQA
ncbi:MAG: helix-turn-helix domain-containing protein [Drouetiella hepatica Uher 2000/2452]|jgi:transcriptional regulator with XRE-family HTH domain|uniref:Helix-turn-helix domain-containing protein n=1 Tax=Drouetiella hepatica Uher 2000/2452 TaxID=904376 RepID=A0A951UP94_9CYAN|nr:helix-turn-helix domain-containing protein [Drouetiella hepatica Uher 2000/2452]